MDLIHIGNSIKQYRIASGMSQHELAELASISRATLNYLECGKINELGATKLFNIMDILGMSFNMQNAVTADWSVLNKVIKSANVSYQQSLSTSQLEQALINGEIPKGFEGNMLYVIDELSEPMILETIRAVAAKNNIKPRQVWLKTLHLAQQVQSPRRLWHATS